MSLIKLKNGFLTVISDSPICFINADDNDEDLIPDQFKHLNIEIPANIDEVDLNGKTFIRVPISRFEQNPG